MFKRALNDRLFDQDQGLLEKAQPRHARNRAKRLNLLYISLFRYTGFYDDAQFRRISAALRPSTHFRQAGAFLAGVTPEKRLVLS